MGFEPNKVKEKENANRVKNNIYMDSDQSHSGMKSMNTSEESVAFTQVEPFETTQIPSPHQLSTQPFIAKYTNTPNSESVELSRMQSTGEEYYNPDDVDNYSMEWPITDSQTKSKRDKQEKNINKRACCRIAVPIFVATLFCLVLLGMSGIFLRNWIKKSSNSSSYSSGNQTQDDSNLTSRQNELNIECTLSTLFIEVKREPIPNAETANPCAYFNNYIAVTCNGKNKCHVTLNHFRQHAPESQTKDCIDLNAQLNLEYTCREPSNLTKLKCDGNKFLQVNSIKTEFENQTDCLENNSSVLELIQNECDFKSECEVDFTNHSECTNSRHLTIEHVCVSQDDILNEYRVFNQLEIIPELNDQTLLQTLDSIELHTEFGFDYELACLLTCRQNVLCSLAAVVVDTRELNEYNQEFYDFNVHEPKNECKMYNQNSLQYIRKVDAKFELDYSKNTRLFQKSELGKFAKIRFYESGHVDLTMSAYWPINNSLSSLVDKIGDLKAKKPLFVPDRDNKQNGAIRVTNLNSFIEAPANNYFEKDFTFTGWVKFNENIENQAFFDFNTGHDRKNVLRFYLKGKNMLPCFELDNESVISSSALILNQWYHLAVCVKDTLATVFIDGERVVDKKLAKPPKNVWYAFNYIGRSHARDLANSFSNADFDEIKIFKRALTEEEVANEMNGHNTIYEF